MPKNEFVSMATIRNRVSELARKIDVPQGRDYLPTYGRSRDFAYPHIEVDDRGYHYVVIERGQELKRKTTQNLNELLEWIFTEVTWSMALDYELQNRAPNQDGRQILFNKQLELLGLLDESWQAHRAAEIEDILTRSSHDRGTLPAARGERATFQSILKTDVIRFLSRLFSKPVQAANEPIILVSGTEQYPTPKDVYLALLAELEANGGDFVTIEQVNAAGWVQVSFNYQNYPLREALINFSYAHDQDPYTVTRDSGIALADHTLLSWEPQKFATFSVSEASDAELAATIDSLVIRLFGALPTDQVKGWKK